MNTRGKIGEVWVYNDGTKKRPTLIINDGIGIDMDFLVTRVTSKAIRNEYDVEITHWQEAELKKPSVVRCSKISTIKDFELEYKIGTLHKNDLIKVRNKVRDYIDKGFEKIAENVTEESE